jgi:hypothetical protein
MDALGHLLGKVVQIDCIELGSVFYLAGRNRVQMALQPIKGEVLIAHGQVADQDTMVPLAIEVGQDLRSNLKSIPPRVYPSCIEDEGQFLPGWLGRQR